MGEATRKSMLQSLLDTFTPAERSTPWPAAAQALLESEGALPERWSPTAESAPPPAARYLPDDALWMLGTPTYQRRIVFTESVGGRFGDLSLTARFILEGWSRSPAGLRWTLDPGAATVLVASDRATRLIEPCLAQAKAGLQKLATREYDGDLEAAIIRAIDEHLTTLGLDRYIPDPAEDSW
jgi:hypothetical protein